jgi:hypothetical protein
MWKSTSSVSSRSSLPPDIVNSEQLSFESNDSFNFDKWNIPKISNKDIYSTSWLKSTWKSEYSVRTIEQTFAISGNNSTFQLFNKRFVNDSKNKEYKFLHVGSVQVAVKPLTRLGINASVLLCLRDARFVNFKTSILGMIQSSLFNGPVHFDVFPNLTLSLDDINILKALTLNVLTSGYDMEEGSRPLAIIYRIYYKLMKTNLDPQAVIKSAGQSTLLIQSSTHDANIQIPKMIRWDDINLPNEWLLENVSKPPRVVNDSSSLDYIQQYLDGSVKISFSDLNIPNRIQRPLPIEGRRNSFAGSSTSEGLHKRDKKIEEMIAELKVSQASPTTPPASSSKTITPISQQFSDTDSVSSHDSTDSDIRILEENFGKVNLEPKLERIFNDSKPVNFAKNWYSRPTPPDLQFEERFLQSQFSVSADKLYEWNIDGLSEQELMNKMNHMSMVANAYDTNHKLSQSEIVDLLATGFSGTLRSWWDKHLTEDSREEIRKAVKKTDCYKRSQRIMVRRRISDVSSVATIVDVQRLANNNQYTFVTKMH